MHGQAAPTPPGITPNHPRRPAAARWRAVFLLALWWLCAGASTAFAQITITVAYPEPGKYYDTSLHVVVKTASVSKVTAVVAKVGTVSKALVTRDNGTTWAEMFALDGLPRGTHEVVVTATNEAGQSAQVQRTFMIDRRPQLTVTSPQQGELARPDVRVVARCTDDGPACQLKVGSVTAVGAIDTIVRPRDGETIIEIYAVDSVGQVRFASRHLYVNGSTNVRHVQSFQGTIFDVRGDRVLLYDDLVNPVVRIVNRSTGASQVIWAPDSNQHLHEGYLTPTGAIFSTWQFPFSGVDLHEWWNGTLIKLGHPVLGSLQVDGLWATFTQATRGPAPGQPIYTSYLRNLTTGTQIEFPGLTYYHDLTADGRIVFSSGNPSEIYELVAGPPLATHRLTNGAPLSSAYPKTDGTNVVFWRAGDGTPGSVILRDGAGHEVVLATGLPAHDPQFVATNPWSVFENHYFVSGGWVAFLRLGSGGERQLWVRAPDGNERRLSSPGAPELEALSETGEVIFASNNGGTRTRYLARPGKENIDLGGTMAPRSPGSVGEVHVPVQRSDGAWYLLFGPHLMAVEDTARSILSEGATNTFFTTDVAILNPSLTAVPVTIKYLRENGAPLQETRELPARSRTTIHENDVPGLESTGVSTVVEAPAHSRLVVERLMTWDSTGYGGHLGSAVEQPRMRWLFAEGAQGFFNTFFLLANSGTSAATVRFTFLIELGTPVTRTVTVAPGTRFTLPAANVGGLANRSFATVVESDVPIVAERAMYFGETPAFYAGHGSAGVSEPSPSWFHAEGATGAFFDTYILLANPHSIAVTADVTFTTDDGATVTRRRTLGPTSRLTINIEEEVPQLANVAAVSTRVATVTDANWSTPPAIVSERAMYWGPPGMGWREAHNSFGATTTGLMWGLAEGRLGGPRGYATYVLVSNSTNDTASLRATFVREDGMTFERTYSLGPKRRLTIDTGTIPELANAKFGTIVESTNDVPINVESAIYWSANGVAWEGGANTVATRLR